MNRRAILVVLLVLVCLGVQITAGLVALEPAPFCTVDTLGRIAFARIAPVPLLPDAPTIPNTASRAPPL